MHVPEALQLSVWVQNNPSSQLEPEVSFAVQLSAASLHDSEQSPSPSAPGQGSPVLLPHAPPEQVSVPLQNDPSVHVEPSVSLAVQLFAVSSHVSEQSPSPSGPGQGLPVPPQTPETLQVSVCVQNRPSSQALPETSLPVQSFADSSQVSEQSPSASGPGHGLPVPPHTPEALQVSVCVQNKPSSQAEPPVSFAVQLLAPSSHVSEQSPSPSGPGQGLPVPTHVPDALQVSV